MRKIFSESFSLDSDFVFSGCGEIYGIEWSFVLVFSLIVRSDGVFSWKIRRMMGLRKFFHCEGLDIFQISSIMWRNLNEIQRGLIDDGRKQYF